jgi:hypothetical protein
MAKAALILVVFPFLNLLAFGSGSCPINLLSAGGDANSISITFQNVGKLPIRQLEFDCVPLQESARKDQHITCREANALFFPGMEYTVSYPYPKGISSRILVSVKSITLSNGYVWKPSKNDRCGELRVDFNRK